ncbi:MAG TPA: hypothetical protein VHZ03_45105 [Trebonia sp.]|nr:hypothetical protein [Trebonia sp.]
MTYKVWRMTTRAVLARRFRRLFRRFGPGGRPPAGVREPRRPRPTLPAAAVALAEPATRHRIRLTRWLRDPGAGRGGA